MGSKTEAKDSRSNSQDSLKVRVNTVVKNEVARALLALKQRGIIVSNTDAINQGILLLRDKVLQTDLELTRLRALKHEQNSDDFHGSEVRG
jgi:hypothetical protein